MLATEAGVRVGDGKTAAAAGGGVMGATGSENNGISRFWFHFSLEKGWGTPHPGWFLAKSAETIENRGVKHLLNAKECARD